MEKANELPAGWMETEHGVFWKQRGHWSGMDTAPRDGRPFVWLRPTLVFGPGHARRVEFNVTVLHRTGTTFPDGPGYWSNNTHSVPDSHATHGWWCPSARMAPDGRLVMPQEAHELIAEHTESEVTA